MATTSSLTRQIRATVLGRVGVGSIDFNRFRRLRRQLNVSQDDVAGWVGVNRTSISHWERGRKTPSAEHARQVAEIIAELERLVGGGS